MLGLYLNLDLPLRPERNHAEYLHLKNGGHVSTIFRYGSQKTGTNSASFLEQNQLLRGVDN